MTRRRWRPVAAAVCMTGVLVASLGNGTTIERIDQLTTAPTWDLARLPDGAGPGVVAKLAALLLVVAGLARLTSGVRTRTGALLAGWGALAVASTTAGLVYVAVTNYVLDGALDRKPGGASTAAIAAMNDGAAFGVYAGWLVGLAVALVQPLARHEGRRPEPVASWPPKPSIGTTRPNPAWVASQPATPVQRTLRPSLRDRLNA